MEIQEDLDMLGAEEEVAKMEEDHRKSNREERDNKR